MKILPPKIVKTAAVASVLLIAVGALASDSTLGYALHVYKPAKIKPKPWWGGTDYTDPAKFNELLLANSKAFYVDFDRGDRSKVVHLRAGRVHQADKRCGQRMLSGGHITQVIYFENRRQLDNVLEKME